MPAYYPHAWHVFFRCCCCFLCLCYCLYTTVLNVMYLMLMKYRFRDDDLLNHMKTEHDSPEVFSCQICDLEFPSMAALMSHQNAHKPKTARSKHDANDGGTCLESGAVFLCATDRESHASGNKAFQCKHCAAICVGPIALALHIEHAHSTFGSDHNRCPLCFKYFLSLDELVAHM